ncbi:MAG: DUF192 domain-containing protein, partial [archaeon]
CKSLWSQTKGLMFTKRIKDTSLVFDFKKIRHVSLHMWFVFYPIDVLFLDKDRKVVDLKKQFRPFGFYTSEKEVKYVVELPSGFIVKNRLKIGSEVDF